MNIFKKIASIFNNSEKEVITEETSSYLPIDNHKFTEECPLKDWKTTDDIHKAVVRKDESPEELHK